jgi:two-component system, OmpR family, sensor histidine kinase VicK
MMARLLSRTVRDSGIGIDVEMLPKLFEKFASKSFQGTGLGLFISKSIVEAHGGKIWAEKNTKERSGATFRFSLPILKENSIILNSEVNQLVAK